jgi:hypothetical protein
MNEDDAHTFAILKQEAQRRWGNRGLLVALRTIADMPSLYTTTQGDRFDAGVLAGLETAADIAREALSGNPPDDE